MNFTAEMKNHTFRLFVAVAVATSLFGGCSTLKKFTGQRNDKILPGQREDILSPDQQVNQDPSISGKKTLGSGDLPCDPTVDVCPPDGVVITLLHS